MSASPSPWTDGVSVLRYLPRERILDRDGRYVRLPVVLVQVHLVDEFDQVEDGEILVCQMTNPAWVVLFTKIAGLVTDTGGTTSHPAVLSREFGIPAVIGTSVATVLNGSVITFSTSSLTNVQVLVLLWGQKQ